MSGDQEPAKHSSSAMVVFDEVMLGDSVKVKKQGTAKQVHSELKINTRETSSLEALFHKAVVENNLSQVREFLESGIKPDVQDINNGKFPLLEATRLGHVNIVKALISAHANVNQANIQGTTALHACFNTKVFKPEVAILFLDQRKANFDLQEKTTGNTPLHILCRVLVSSNTEQESMKELLKEMIPRCQIDLQNKAGNTPLHVLVTGKRDDEKAVKILLEAKPDVNTRNNFGETPLAAAIGNGKFKMAMAITEHGIDTDLRDRCGYTLLHYAATKNSPLIVRRLLEKGSDVNAKDPYGDTVLHLATGKGYAEVVTELLKQEDISINMQNDNGYTPLMCAVDSSFIKVVKLLVNHKCDLSIVSRQSNKTALDIAKENMIKRNKHEIYDFLSEYSK